MCVCRSGEALKSSLAGSVSVHSLVSDDDDVDEDTASLERYGDVDVAKYNEDGSFVGAYTVEPPTRQRGRIMTSRTNEYSVHH